MKQCTVSITWHDVRHLNDASQMTITYEHTFEGRGDTTEEAEANAIDRMFEQWHIFCGHDADDLYWPDDVLVEQVANRLAPYMDRGAIASVETSDIVRDEMEYFAG